MQRMATFEAGEVGSSPAIVLISKATTRAGLRGVPGVDNKDGHAGLLSLVGEKLPQLTETPIRLPRPLPRANREPAPDVGQVFQYQDGLRVFGVSDEAFGQGVIHPALTPRLPPSHLLQAPLRTLRPSGLIGVAGRLPALARAFNGVTGAHMAVGIGDQIDNAQIDPKKLSGLQGGLFGDINRGIQIN
jgi:hypothetical protein